MKFSLITLEGNQLSEHPHKKSLSKDSSERSMMLPWKRERERERLIRYRIHNYACSGSRHFRPAEYVGP